MGRFTSFALAVLLASTAIACEKPSESAKPTEGAGHTEESKPGGTDGDQHAASPAAGENAPDVEPDPTIPDADAPAAVVGTATKLQGTERLGFSFDDGVPDVAWTSQSGDVVTFHVAVAGNEESAVVQSIIDGNKADLFGMTYDTARGGSGISYRIVSDHEVEVVGSYGAAGADPGEQTAHLFRYEAATGELTRLKTWSGSLAVDLPDWSEVPGSTR